MKQENVYILLLLTIGLFLLSCQEDQLSKESIFKDPGQENTEFDNWLERHYLKPFNIRFEYRMPDREGSFSYWVTPPPVEKAIEVAKVIKHTTIDAMVEMMVTDDPNNDPTLFVKTYFPKVLFLVGSYQINDAGVTILGSAENGLQINILGVTRFSIQDDSERIAGLMLHEFAHIIDAVHPVPADFNAVTPNDYIGDRYSTAPNDYLQAGFLSNYARSHPAEDIAVTTGELIARDEQWWEATYAAAGEEGAAKLEKKVSILTAWLRDSYEIDVNKWREIYLRRLSEVAHIDYTNLND